MSSIVIRRAVLGISLLTGCVADEGTPSAESGLPTPKGPPTSTEGTNEDTTSASADDSVSSSTTSDSAGTTEGAGVESGSETDCPAGCSRPPSDCHESSGECVDGECHYAPLSAGASCEDGDLCTQGDLCDGDGSCVSGEVLQCDRPNAENGTCVAGECQGWSCIDPYENCDGDWDNGCEIPTGVANACNNNGIQEAGACGTAYCGTAVGPTVVNFPAANYRCVMCSNCTVPQEGQTAWCNQNTGHWWPAEPGSCPSSFQHAVCGP